MKFKKNTIEPIWLDFNSNANFLGLAKLLEYKGKGLPFMMEDEPEHKQITYNSEKWLVEFVESDKYPKGFRKIINLRIVDTLKVAQEEYEMEPQLLDNFLMVNGKEIY